jgi:hypothetical protein
MLQMRMHSYEFEILRSAFGGTQNDISRQAHPAFGGISIGVKESLWTA